MYRPQNVTITYLSKGKKALITSEGRSEETFTIPNADLITKEISKAKIDAIAVCKSCGHDSKFIRRQRSGSER